MTTLAIVVKDIISSTEEFISYIQYSDAHPTSGYTQFTGCMVDNLTSQNAYVEIMNGIQPNFCLEYTCTRNFLTASLAWSARRISMIRKATIIWIIVQRKGQLKFLCHAGNNGTVVIHIYSSKGINSAAHPLAG